MDCYICNSALDHFSICETCYKKADVELERVRKLYAKEMEDCNAAHKRAGSHWKKLEAEIQAHNITKKELLTAEAELSEARAKSSRLEARCGDLQEECDQLKAENERLLKLLIIAHKSWIHDREGIPLFLDEWEEVNRIAKAALREVDGGKD